MDEPGEENATVLPWVSASRLMPLSGRAYQRLGGAGRFRTDDLHRHALGIGRDHAEHAVGLAMSMLPAITGVSVQAPPSV